MNSSSISRPDARDAKLRTEAEERALTALLGPPWRTMTLEELPMLLPRGVVFIEIGADDVCDVWLADGPLAALSTEAADAHLTAAAPELLDALRRLEKPAPGVKRLPPWAVGIARAAIAKAEGPR